MNKEQLIANFNASSVNSQLTDDQVSMYFTHMSDLYYNWLLSDGSNVQYRFLQKLGWTRDKPKTDDPQVLLLHELICSKVPWPDYERDLIIEVG
jgi:hypothetical protein